MWYVEREGMMLDVVVETGTENDKSMWPWGGDWRGGRCSV